MNHDTYRRKLLRLTATLPVSLPVFSMQTQDAGHTRMIYPLNSPAGMSTAHYGSVVLADTAVNKFRGDGFYLYPDWGSPVVYEVKQRGNRLFFHYPGKAKCLWQISPSSQEARFCGLVTGILDKSVYAIEEADNLQLLHVPERPNG